MWTCSTCGEVHDGQFASCWKCEAGGGSSPGKLENASAGQGTATIHLAAQQGKVTVADFGRSMKTRYAEAYTAAHGVSYIGHVIKVIGVVVLSLGGMGMMIALGRDDYGSISVLGVAFAGMLALTGGFVSIMGLFLAAQAQLNLSALDCAVHTSPFLTETQRADTMRLRLQSTTAVHPG